MSCHSFYSEILKYFGVLFCFFLIMASPVTRNMYSERERASFYFCIEKSVLETVATV